MNPETNSYTTAGGIASRLLKSIPGVIDGQNQAVGNRIAMHHSMG